MDEKLLQELLDEFIPTLESLEAQSMAAIQFLKDQKAGNEKKLAPYLENAAKASNVKWLAVRLRLGHLISSAVKNAERAEEEKMAEQKAQTKKDKAEEQSATEASATEEPKNKPDEQMPQNKERESSEKKDQPENDNMTPTAKEEPEPQKPKSEAA